MLRTQKEFNQGDKGTRRKIGDHKNIAGARNGDNTEHMEPGRLKNPKVLWRPGALKTVN